MSKKLLIFTGAGFSAALAPDELLTARQMYDKLTADDHAMINRHDLDIMFNNKQESRALRHRIFFYLESYFEKFFNDESKRINIEALAVQINKCIEAVKQLDYSALLTQLNFNGDVILQTQRQTDDSLREKRQRRILHKSSEELFDIDNQDATNQITQNSDRRATTLRRYSTKSD